MNISKYVFTLLFLFFSSFVSAESWYQVEVIVFDRIFSNLDGEMWQQQTYMPRDNMIELQPTDRSLNEQGLIPYMVIDHRNRMGGIYRVLKNSSGYRPLMHLSWQQPATQRNRAKFVHLQRLESGSAIPVSENVTEEEPEFIEAFVQPDRLIDGAIRIRSGFYLHADVDLSYFKRLAPENKIIRTSEESFADASEKTVINLKETRKMKLNEIHYFDHPMFGLILQVSRL